ncbi:hypothetical protein ACFE04_015020 [Oxalis oulophora]
MMLSIKHLEVVDEIKVNWQPKTLEEEASFRCMGMKLSTFYKSTSRAAKVHAGQRLEAASGQREGHGFWAKGGARIGARGRNGKNWSEEGWSEQGLVGRDWSVGTVGRGCPEELMVVVER